MKTGIPLVIALCGFLLIVPPGSEAQETRHVYEVRAAGEPSALAYTAGMRVAAEAARLFVPVRFSKKGDRVEFQLTGAIEFSGLASVEVARWEGSVVLRHEFLVGSPQRLPKADKRFTVRFSLAELKEHGGSYAASPLLYAVFKAIRASPYARGSAWILSERFTGTGFVVIVGLSAS
ncbi:MAG: hypothetical protein JXM71_11245 [Spirochaetales bacterium]|nr:hypothetical protein [Spirochaetales bacterium]